jgi:hypothetical protein
VLSAQNIPWKYYGNGFNASGTGGPLDAYCNICNPLEYEAIYPSMVAEPYARCDNMPAIGDPCDMFTFDRDHATIKTK